MVQRWMRWAVLLYFSLNDLYRRVINRNNRLASPKSLAPEITIRNEKRMQAKAVDALIVWSSGTDGGGSKQPPTEISVEYY